MIELYGPRAVSVLYLAVGPDFGLGFARAAYLVMSVAFFGYAGWLLLAQRRLRLQLERLEQEPRRRGEARP